MGVFALAAPPCLSLGLMVMMCAPMGRPTSLTVPESTRFSYAQTTKEGYGGVVAYGAPVPAARLRAAGSPNPTSVHCAGRACVALATLGGFQYPVRSGDAGRTWTNAGHWFAGAWADAPAFATRVEALAPGVYAAWPSLHGVYLTADAGRVWYAVATPGRPTSVSVRHGAIAIRVATGAGRHRAFDSRDGGRLWTRAGA